MKKLSTIDIIAKTFFPTKEKIWCGICGRRIYTREYKKDLQNLKNTPNNACKFCRK